MSILFAILAIAFFVIMFGVSLPDYEERTGSDYEPENDIAAEQAAHKRVPVEIVSRGVSGKAA